MNDTWKQQFAIVAIVNAAIRPDPLRPGLGRSQSGQIPSVSIEDGHNLARFLPSSLKTTDKTK
jgi:hypothetical protein